MLGRKTMLRKKKPSLEWLLITGAVFIFFYFIIKHFPPLYNIPQPPTPTTPTAVVEQFYEYEKIGDYGSSWELFHPLMKQRFDKDTYIQQRSKMFMQNFGGETFTFTVGRPTAVHSWKMTPESPSLEAYQVPVTETFHSAFGVFTLQQDMYVADDNGSLRVLWQY